MFGDLCCLEAAGSVKIDRLAMLVVGCDGCDGHHWMMETIFGDNGFRRICSGIFSSPACNQLDAICGEEKKDRILK